jgi:diguanylate cyclase (GGDEF)-like protein
MNTTTSSSKVLEILLIEDSKGSALLIKRVLKQVMPNGYNLIHAYTLEEALNALTNKTFDIALLDRSLPDSKGFDGLHNIQNRAPNLPIIYLTGYNDEQTAFESIRQGAQDYVFKDNLDGHLLKKSIQYAILRKEFEVILTTRANFDTLTGLANRMLFENRLDLALTKVERHHGYVAVLFIDLDEFKQINDTMGHAAGDEMLVEFAMRLKSVLRPYDTAARFGGDEFAVLIEEIPEIDEVITIAQKIIQQFETGCVICGTELKVGVSIGISYFKTGQIKTGEQLIQEADEAMYEAKEIQGSAYHIDN